ncbi:sensor histidine kinase [Lentzea tibetensis]|uniref:histidine kinase n=1 Tax=Lentzea tibetensis TaxID=2591470 RepID=A0A563EJJ7_9PSEU|nr:histidine kinase [Lentzea tibetensis]TWP46872.1 sensor histidine kinase [Lentzea tibetensis]
MRISWQDMALTGALVVIGFGGTRWAALLQSAESPGGLAYGLVVVAALSVLFRSIAPLWTYAMTVTCIAVYLWLGYPFGPILLSGIAAMYAVALRSSVRTILICALLYTAVVVPRFVAEPLDILTWSLGWIFLPAAVGFAMRIRRRSVADTREHAVTEERLLLAQEVHDVVGHGLAVIAMQAGVALYVLDRDPAKARASLEAIRDTSRDALDGLRGELDSLRGNAPLRPSTSLVDIPALAARMRSAGLPVSVVVSAADLPEAIETAAYRIVQESLTNVLRHAGSGVTASVEVSVVDSVLVVSVVDTGATSDFVEGHGITGMRRRATSLGGTLDAGPDESGGFAVRARIPLAS